VNKQGEKLSKQTLALPIDIENARASIFDALNVLGQQPLAEIQNATIQELWRWASDHWDIKKVSVQNIFTDA
jgi:glutamyl-Q tRNA(Asp) synthetase